MRKIDQVVDELKNYRINVAGLQETKWFGAEEYRVGDSIVLTSGREVPSLGRSHRRGEGVALVLHGSIRLPTIGITQLCPSPFA